MSDSNISPETPTVAATEDRPLAGGMALLGGVTMTVAGSIAAAVRLPDGSIKTKEIGTLSAKTGKFRQTPFLRGLFIGSGMQGSLRAMRWALAETEPDNAKKLKIESKSVAVMLTISFVSMCVLFAMLPSIIGHAVASGHAEFLAEGAARFGLFLGYLAAIKNRSMVKAFFQSHGAEHKVVAAYELVGPTADLATVARDKSRLHPRCGTSLLIIALGITTLLSGAFWWMPGVAAAFIRPVLLLAAVSVSYELMRLSAPHMDKKWARALMYPGLQAQRLTTSEPDDEQLEVAAVSLRTAYAMHVAASSPITDAELAFTPAKPNTLVEA